MLLLNENNSGSIQRKEFEDALNTVKDNGLAPSMDVETIVQNIFGYNA